uniref:Putative tick salivary cystatin n=1 Tax=Rhipicephalus pulchellus TaxID=72859 RepID=L7LPR5_RHIPC
MKILLTFALALLAVSKSFSKVANAGWRIHDPFSNPKFLQLAHYALTRQPNAGGIPGVAVRLHQVATQGTYQTGVRYLLSFDLVPLTCSSHQVPSYENSTKASSYTSVFCIMGEAMNSCSALVFEEPAGNAIHILGIDCLH